MESVVPTWRANEGWRIDDTPSLSIGTVDGAPEYQLTNVRGVAQLSDGRIVVANAGTMEIRCYAPDGRFLWASGRRRQGPGDYWTLTKVSAYRADSVLVHDFGLRRYSVIDPSGRFVRAWPMRAPDDSTATSSLHLSGVFADGTMAIFSSPARRGRSPPMVTRAATRLFLYGPTGEPLAIMGSFPGDEYYEGQGFAIRRLPFARSTRFATSDSAVFAATDDAYEIRRLDRRGIVSMLVRRTGPAQSITPSDKAAERERLREERQRERMKRFRGMPDSILSRLAADEEQMFDAMPFPPSYPAYGSMVVDRERYLWVQEFAERIGGSVTGQHWSVFHPDGRWLGDVRLPPGLTLYGATAHHVLGVQTDDLGVEFVRAFAIVGRRPSNESGIVRRVRNR